MRRQTSAKLPQLSRQNAEPVSWRMTKWLWFEDGKHNICNSYPQRNQIKIRVDSLRYRVVNFLSGTVKIIARDMWYCNVFGAQCNKLRWNRPGSKVFVRVFRDEFRTISVKSTRFIIVSGHNFLKWVGKNMNYSEIVFSTLIFKIS